MTFYSADRQTNTHWFKRSLLVEEKKMVVHAGKCKVIGR